MRFASSSILLLAVAAGADAVRTMIPKTSFNSQADFDADWNYNYPWGTDHNGGARMDKAQVRFSDGMLTLAAKKVTGQKDAKHGGKNIKINYLSGAIGAKEHFNVSRGGGYDFSGEFKATTTKGTWPAFWLTAVDGWPPEIDMAEWKGSGKISFNTFNTSSVLSWKDVTYPSPNEFHSIKCELRDINQKEPPAPPPLSQFTRAILPPTLVNNSTTSVLKAPRPDQKYNARFLLFKKDDPGEPTKHRSAYSCYKGSTFGTKMLNYIQLTTTPTADTPGTSLLLHFDNQRYVFGNISEGTQRALVQRKTGLNKVEDVFMTGVVNWHNAGGLMGLVLTLADSLASAKEHLESQAAMKKKNNSQSKPLSVVPPKLNIHGGKNLAHLLATSRRFIFRKGLPLNPLEIRDDHDVATREGAEPDWKDQNINVWYLPISSTQKSSSPRSPKKRSHAEFNETTTSEAKNQSEEESKKIVETIVSQMFNSDWSMDALVETTLYQAKLPAKLFVRNDKGHIEEYTGPLPGQGQNVPDVPVLVRTPWPGATVDSLPRTRPSTQSLCYIVKGHDRRGKFNPQAAEKLGVEKRNFKILASGQNAPGKDGTIVTPDMVLGETVTGTGFAIVDLPDMTYFASLQSRPEWSNTEIMKGIKVVFWTLGASVSNDIRLQEFMTKMSDVEHIVSSPDGCPNMLALESVAAQSFKLRSIDPGRFPLPAYSNKLTLRDTPFSLDESKSMPSPFTIGRTGKTVQFAPSFLNQDDKIVRFPDIEKISRTDLTSEVRQLAEKAQLKVTDAKFLEKVEKAELDIPNRDAEIITLGTGSALPSKYRNVSATMVRVPGYGNYLFDAGENTLGQMRRVFGSDLPQVLRDLKGIWISHLHADHHLGTASVIKAWHEETSVTNPSARLLVSSHYHMIDWLREYADVEDYGFHRLFTSVFSKYDRGTRISDPRIFTAEETDEFGLARIDAAFVQHCFGALATVFTFPSGLKIAYSGDCRPSDAFVKIGEGATILIHESTFDDELRGDAIAKKHSTMSEAIDVGRRMGARRIMLTHFSQRYQKVPILEENLEPKPDVDAKNAKDKARADEVILVAFDYMRVKLGEFRKAQAFLPAIQKLLEDAEQ
ncbi:hypothetical protein F5Y15DRAFT_407876 [Xylariaceae sp. FL0016]|nr:hypothetical protein F5Y15DRAFT_407876 [Xylariaceae sp. FL0016]